MARKSMTLSDPFAIHVRASKKPSDGPNGCCATSLMVALALNLASSSSPIRRLVIKFQLSTRFSLPGYAPRLNSLSRGCRNYLCDVSYIMLRILLHLRDFSTWYARSCFFFSSRGQSASTLGIWNMHHSSMEPSPLPICPPLSDYSRCFGRVSLFHFCLIPFVSQYLH
jgi:hypothetical protein